MLYKSQKQIMRLDSSSVYIQTMPRNG